MSGLPALRAAGPGDAEPMAALIRLAFAAQSVVTDPLPSALRESAATIETHFAKGDGGFLIEGPAACLLWAVDERGLYLGRVAVHPDWRGRGLAKRLIAATEEVARERGLKLLHLSTRLVLTDNRRLFAACGFVETKEEAHPGYAHPTFVHMEKRLG
jgi:GNAT superfamily N-acetyltransferase